MKNPLFNLRLPPETVERLRALAAVQGTSMSCIIRMLIEGHLTASSQRHKSKSGVTPVDARSRRSRGRANVKKGPSS